MYTMNNHTMQRKSVTAGLAKSCLGAKDTTQSLWETLVSLLKKCCCHKKCCGRMGCGAVMCSKPAARYGLHQTVKVACSSV